MKFVPHTWKSDRFICRIVGRSICIGCGLLRLRNALTDWCVSKGCNYDENPGYRDALRRLPREEWGV